MRALISEYLVNGKSYGKYDLQISQVRTDANMEFKLANIVLSNSVFSLNNPTLWCRREGGHFILNEDGSFTLLGPGSFDFTTYFNALSSMKWKRYTVARDFYLHLEYKGSSGTLIETAADAFDWSTRKIGGSDVQLETSDEWKSLDIKLSVIEGDVLNAFIVNSNGEIVIRNAYYYTCVDSSEVHAVELALATTTFRKESYIYKNIDLIETHVLSSNEPIADHFHVHVIDNGRTLNKDHIQSNRIHLHPNPNVGGSGGFARGMIEAMEQSPKATHVLLMDDDVEVMPESFIRTYNLLSILNDEYKEAFISGAMMSLEEPDLRTEDLGFFTYKGKFQPLKPAGRMSILHDVIETETFVAPTDDPSCQDTLQRYAGWWYCCIPMYTIEREGLPLPLFVRSDDAEYSLRCNPKFITMNSICVWHASFFFKYNAAVERYQVSRNPLVCQFTSGIAPLSDFVEEVYREVQLDLKKFNYDDALLAVEGFEDFLKGPSFIREPITESRFLDANKHREKLVPFKELQRSVEDYGINLKSLTHSEVVRDVPRNKFEAAKDFLTFNGQRFIREEGKRGNRVAVIDAAGWVYPAGKIRGAEVLVAIDMPNRCGAVRRLDIKRFNEVWGRFRKAMVYYKKNEKQLRDEYSRAREELISVAFWKDYLKKASE